MTPQVDFESRLPTSPGERQRAEPNGLIRDRDWWYAHQSMAATSATQSNSIPNARLAEMNTRVPSPMMKQATNTALHMVRSTTPVGHFRDDLSLESTL
jgi:hypothetical protein